MPPVAAPTLQFPDASLFRRAEAVAVYVSPLAYADERICIGIAARLGDTLKVAPVPGLRRLRCSYGKSFRTLDLAAKLALESLAIHLATRPLVEATLKDWARPSPGVFLGDVQVTSARNIDQAIDALLREFSSLYATDAPAEEEEVEERAAGVSSARLERMVKEQVLALRPEFSSRFDRRYQVSEGARSLRIGYSGQRIVSNFALLWPTQLSGGVRNSKAKLWDLVQARDGATAGWFGTSQPMSFELLVHHASENDVAVTERGIANVKEALEELETEADKHDLRCRPILSPEAIANYLIETESA
jgi:hypothetical protein